MAGINPARVPFLGFYDPVFPHDGSAVGAPHASLAISFTD
jgi:hypothetical protein